MAPTISIIDSGTSVREDAVSVITVTPTTTIIFITSSFPPISTSSSKSSSNASKQKAVIAGSAVGGFVGFSLILGVLIWVFYFRKPDGTTQSGVVTQNRLPGGKLWRRKDEKHVASSSMSTATAGHIPFPNPEPEDEEGEKSLDRPDPVPIQPHSPSLAGPSSSNSRSRPFLKRTITSVSESGDPRRIPVVVPSFAYRDSVASSSSGSRLANVLKRTSHAGATVSSSSSGARSSVPYQYGVVGSAESRRGSMLDVDNPPSQLGRIYPHPQYMEGVEPAVATTYGPVSSGGAYTFRS